ncbi:MAG: spore germination protein [Alkaliphilus sp.]|nr:MAG: spore germination protein [Alkaliphilus sp.]
MPRKISEFFQYLKYSAEEKSLNRSALITGDEKIASSIDKIIDQLKNNLGESSDLIIRSFKIESFDSNSVLVYMDGLVNKHSLEFSVLTPLMQHRKNCTTNNISRKLNIDFLINDVIHSLYCFQSSSMHTSIEHLLNGHAIVFIENTNKSIIIDSKGWETRNITEPATEAVVRGSREGFNENIQTNLTLIRRRLKTPKFKTEGIVLGTYSNTSVVICYIEGIADKRIIEEVKDRVKKIKIDAILESGYIEQFIDDHPLTPLPTVGYTEKPDALVGKLLEGRVGILCDGTPFVLTVPHLFVESIQTAEDYYVNPFYSSTLRIIRLFALLLTTSLPAFYVAVKTFHHEIIPFDLYMSIAAVREGIPMPSFMEALMMISIFELLKEAGLRMPRAIGQAVSIVGAVVLGQATVEAGIATPLMVIVISITAITGFIVPQLDIGILFLRVLLLLLANVVGFFGIALGVVLVFIHMCNLRSFGINYLYPVSPIVPADLKDTYFRFPFWKLLFDDTTISLRKND